VAPAAPRAGAGGEGARGGRDGALEGEPLLPGVRARHGESAGREPATDPVDVGRARPEAALVLRGREPAMIARGAWILLLVEEPVELRPPPRREEELHAKKLRARRGAFPGDLDRSGGMVSGERHEPLGPGGGGDTDDDDERGETESDHAG